MKRVSEKLKEVLGYYKEKLPKEWGHFSIAAMHEAVEIAQEHEAKDGWQPIADAPQDGWVIVGWWGANGNWTVRHAQLVAGRWVGATMNAYSPTHYLPCPTPPERP